jgi:hypothetical protein
MQTTSIMFAIVKTKLPDGRMDESYEVNVTDFAARV